MSNASPVIELSGDLDTAARAAVRALLDQIATTPVAIIDLTRVGFIGSSGVTELLYAFRKRHEQSLEAMRLVVVPGSTVSRVLEVAGLTKVFPIYRTVDEATSG